MSTPATAETTAPLCPAGHGAMRQRTGKTGAFWGCVKYPECRSTAPVGLPGIFCPQCNAPIVERVAKKSGRPFWPCGNRACEFVSWEKQHHCRGCGGVCFGAEERSRLAPDAVPDPAIQPSEDDEVPF